MANYRVVLTVSDKRLDAVKKQIAQHFPNEAASVAKLGDSSSRQSRLDEAKQMVEDAVCIVEELQQEMQDWYDNMPENFQNGDKGSEVEEEAQNLESLKDELEGIDWDSASNFPGMY